MVRVQLVTHLDNERSQRVAERRGFSREGVLRAWEPVKDEQPDVVMWSRLASDPAPEPGHA
jgi:RimJ/RimL family protein N-acetyltransferase